MISTERIWCDLGGTRLTVRRSCTDIINAKQSAHGKGMLQHGHCALSGCWGATAEAGGEKDFSTWHDGAML